MEDTFCPVPHHHPFRYFFLLVPRHRREPAAESSTAIGFLVLSLCVTLLILPYSFSCSAPPFFLVLDHDFVQRNIPEYRQVFVDEVLLETFYPYFLCPPDCLDVFCVFELHFSPLFSFQDCVVSRILFPLATLYGTFFPTTFPPRLRSVLSLSAFPCPPAGALDARLVPATRIRLPVHCCCKLQFPPS